MVSRPEIVTYKSNVAVVFLVNLSLGLFLQAQRKAQPVLLAIGLKRKLAGWWGYFARREASKAMKANANATTSKTIVARIAMTTCPPVHQ